MYNLELQQKWLVTGAAGFIGSHLIETLLKNNQKVIGFDNFSTGKKENLHLVLSQLSPSLRQNFTFIEGDIRNYNTCLEATKDIDFVLHQAALGSVPRSIKDPLTTNDVNVTGFLNILFASTEHKVSRFVYASSSSVYGDSPDLPKIESRIGNLLSPYATSKRVNELYADVFLKTYGLQTIGLRYFNVFGPRQDPESLYAAVIPLWINSLLNNKPCYINGDGTNSRDFCYIDNVVQANIKAALCEKTEAYGQNFNIAFGERTNLNELFNIISNLINKDSHYVPNYREKRPGDVAHSLADITKAKEILSYNPTHSIMQGMELTVNSYIEKHNLVEKIASI